MNAVLNVAKREIVERKLVLLLGLAIGVLPFLALPFVHAGPEAHAWAAFLGLIAFAWGTAILVGGTIYAGDLVDRRLGFYLARPLSPASVMGGKLLAAAALVIGGSLLAMLPAILLGGSTSRALSTSEAAVAVWLFAVGMALLAIPVANHVGLAMRSHSPWILVDVAAFIAAGFLVFASWRVLWRNAYGEFLGVPLVALLVVLPLCCLAGAFIQAHRARTDVVAAHRAATLATWTPLVALCALFAAGTWWFVHPSPSAMKKVYESSVDATGRWALVGGMVEHRPYIPFAFLVDLERPDRFLRFGPMPYQWDLAFSKDGKRVAWLTLADDASPWSRRNWNDLRLEAVTARLDDARPEIHHLHLEGFQGARLALSASGARLVVVDGSQVTVLDLTNDRSIFSARMPDSRFRIPRFLDEDHVRIGDAWAPSKMEAEPRRLPILEADLAAKKLVQTGEVEIPSTTFARIATEASGERLLVLPVHAPARLCDGRTGRPLAELGDGSGAFPSAAFLADGRIVLARMKKEEGLSLLVFSRTGEPLGTIPLGSGRGVRLGGQPTPGTLVVCLTRPDTRGIPVGSDSLLVDLAAGKVVKRLDGLVPLASTSWWFPGTTRPVGRSATLFADGGTICELDLASGARKQLMPR